MFRGEGRKPFLQEATVEIRVMGDDEHYPAQKIVYGAIIYAVTADHLIGDAGNVRDLGWDRKAGIFQPLPGVQDSVDPPVLTVIFEEANAEFDDAALLRPYRAVVTGSHPEYHTANTLDALQEYIGGGGRLAYLGGNGFYWRIATSSDIPDVLEIRRAEGGIRTWTAEPGEYFHALDGHSPAAPRP